LDSGDDLLRPGAEFGGNALLYRWQHRVRREAEGLRTIAQPARRFKA
jgi:hypothetical protein